MMGIDKFVKRSHADPRGRERQHWAGEMPKRDNAGKLRSTS